MSCRTGCLTQDHSSWGACARAADFQVDVHGLQNRNVELDKDRRLSRYEDARRQGLQPKTTKWTDVRAAFETGGVEKTTKAVTSA